MKPHILPTKARERNPQTLCAAVGFADGIGGIQSQNIVGYNTVNIHMKYTLLGVNFQSVDGGALPISDAIPVCDAMTRGSGVENADNIQIMNSTGGYDVYYLSNGKVGRNTYPDTIGKWVYSLDNTHVSSNKISVGTAFWFESQNGEVTPYDISVAGAVLMSDSDTKDITMKYTLVASPYPCEIALNGGVVVENPTIGTGIENADNIQIMNEEGGYDVYYLSNGKVGRNTYPETEGKWVYSLKNTEVTTASFPVGRSAWFLSQSANTKLTFKNPAK